MGGYCDYFRASTDFSTKNTITGTKYGIYVNIDNTIASTISSFKTWLETHNTTVYYQLETPTNTEITETSLINELEIILQAKSYNEQTNISQTNNDLPFIIDLQYLMKEGE